MKIPHAHFYGTQYPATHAMTWERRRPCSLVSGTVLDHICNDRRGVIDHALLSIASDIVVLYYAACDDMRGGENSAAIPTKLSISLSGFGSFKQPNETIWVPRISPGLLAPQVMEAINSESLKSTSVACWGQARCEANAFLATYIHTLVALFSFSPTNFVVFSTKKIRNFCESFLVQIQPLVIILCKHSPNFWFLA